MQLEYNKAMWMKFLRMAWKGLMICLLGCGTTHLQTLPKGFSEPVQQREPALFPFGFFPWDETAIQMRSKALAAQRLQGNPLEQMPAAPMKCSFVSISPLYQRDVWLRMHVPKQVHRPDGTLVDGLILQGAVDNEETRLPFFADYRNRLTTVVRMPDAPWEGASERRELFVIGRPIPQTKEWVFEWQRYVGTSVAEKSLLPVAIFADDGTPLKTAWRVGAYMLCKSRDKANP